MNSDSFFLSEIRRIMSSFNPLGTLSASTWVTKPHLYSRSARSRMVLTFVLIAFSQAQSQSSAPVCHVHPGWWSDGEDESGRRASPYPVPRAPPGFFFNDTATSEIYTLSLPDAYESR